MSPLSPAQRIAGTVQGDSGATWPGRPERRPATGGATEDEARSVRGSVSTEGTGDRGHGAAAVPA